MKKPIAVGDMCRVVDGFRGKESPNIGLIVEVTAFLTDKFGGVKLFRCKAEYGERAGLVQSPNVPPGYADFFEPWLEPIIPPKPVETITTELEKQE